MLSSSGEKIGKIKDFYFDSQELVVRYIIVDTGSWLISRKVLISPEAFVELDWDGKSFLTNLSKDEIENSPPIDMEKPVSRQMEEKLVEHYGWTNYWTQAGSGTFGYPAAYPSPLPPIDEEEKELEEKKREHIKNDYEENRYLRSLDEVKGYKIDALDGKLGGLASLLVEENSWKIHYLVVDTKKLFGGKKVLIAAEWLDSIAYAKKEVNINLSKDIIENAPEYHEDTVVTREYEEELYDYFDKKYYW